MRILTSASIAVLATATLTFGACGGKSKAPDTNIASANSMMSALTDIPARKVDDAQSMAALKELGMAEANDVMSWGGMSGENGTYTYNDVKIENGEVTFGTMTISGVRSEGGKSRFDLLVIEDVVMDYDDGNGKIGKIILSEPSAAFSTAIASELKDMGSVNPEYLMDPGVVGGFAMDDADFVMDGDVRVKIDDMVFDMNDGSGKGQFSIVDFSIVPTREEGNISIAKIEGSGIDVAGIMGLMESVDNGDPMAMMGMMGMDPANPPFKAFNIENMNANIDGMQLSLEQYVGAVDVKGDMVTSVGELKPLKLSFNKDGSRTNREMAEQMEKMGYPELEFTSIARSEYNAKTDTMSVPEYYIDMKDGARMNINYAMSGMKNMASMSQMDDPMDAFSRMTLNNGRFSFEDKGLRERAFKLAADMQGASVATVKSQAKAGLGFLSMSAENPSQRKVFAQLSKAASDFIDNGGEFIIGMNPDNPMKISDMFDLADGADFSKLNLTIQTQ